MSQVSKTPTLVKPAEVGELQHKVVVEKEVKKYKPKSIFADYKKKEISEDPSSRISYHLYQMLILCMIVG